MDGGTVGTLVAGVVAVVQSICHTFERIMMNGAPKVDNDTLRAKIGLLIREWLLAAKEERK
jgi:hypothetical protein